MGGKEKRVKRLHLFSILYFYSDLARKKEGESVSETCENQRNFNQMIVVCKSRRT